jgi:uncharacterized membrane protein
LDSEHHAPTTPPDVPFAGLRSHAKALFAGTLIVAAILWLVPDLTPAPTQPPPLVLLRGTILEFLASGADATRPDVRLLITEGDRLGEQIDGYLQGPSGQQDLPRYQIGDEVVISASLEPDDTFIAVSDLYRIPALGLLVATFAVAVTVVGGWRGVRSLIALALTLVVIVRLVVPLILSGYNPVWVAIIFATGVTVVTFLLTEGARPQTLAAALGTFVSLALVAVLAVVFDGLARFTTLLGSEDATFLQAVGLGDIDVGGLLLAAIIFGALGILDDVTITQAATIAELHETDPRASRTQLARRGMNVGRSHIAATVNTLVLAYVGASLPLIVVFAAGRQDPFLTASAEIVAVEVVRALVGSIGIVAAVPVTTAIMTLLIGRRIPFLGGGAESGPEPGWD